MVNSLDYKIVLQVERNHHYIKQIFRIYDNIDKNK